MSTVLERLERYWASQGLGHGPPAAPGDLAGFESHYGVRLPSDLHAYFRAMNGSEAGMNGPMDDYLLSFCNLSEVRPLSEVAPELGAPNADEWFMIADHSIGVHPYVVRLSAASADPAPVAVVYNEFVVVVAPSFEAFLDGYCNRNEDMLFPMCRRSGPRSTVCRLSNVR